MMKICLLLVVCAAAWNVARAECGVSTVKQSSSLLVVGGEEAQNNAWPWQISLREKSFWFGDKHICGGTLITNQWIVTAAHCVYGKEYSFYYNIWLGAHDVEYQDSTTVSVSPSKIISHPGFAQQPPTNDIALIKLSNKVSLTDAINTACLPSKTYTSGYGYLTGWGDTQANGVGSYPRYLQQVKTPIIDNTQCNTRIKGAGDLFDPVDDTMMCAGYSDQEKGACSGDSGGPFVVKNSAGKWELAGVVSWGLFPCAQNGIPSVYTDVFAFKDWIATTIANN